MSLTSYYEQGKVLAMVKTSLRCAKISLRQFIHLIEDNHTTALHEVGELEKTLYNLKYEGKISFGKNLKRAYVATTFFDRELTSHIQSEEKIVFPIPAVLLGRRQSHCPNSALLKQSPSKPPRLTASLDGHTPRPPQNEGGSTL